MQPEKTHQERPALTLEEIHADLVAMHTKMEHAGFVGQARVYCSTKVMADLRRKLGDDPGGHPVARQEPDGSIRLGEFVLYGSNLKCS